MKFDLTITISVVLGLAAVISPMLTTLIDNRYKLKLRRLEIEHEKFMSDNFRIIQFMEEYLACLFLLADHDTGELFSTIQDYQKALACAVPYLPKDAYCWAQSLDLEKPNPTEVWNIADAVRAEIEQLRLQSTPSKSR